MLLGNRERHSSRLHAVDLLRRLQVVVENGLNQRVSGSGVREVTAGRADRRGGGGQLVPIAAAGTVDHHVLIGHTGHKPGLIKKIGKNSCLVLLIHVKGTVLDRHRSSFPFVILAPEKRIVFVFLGHVFFCAPRRRHHAAVI